MRLTLRPMADEALSPPSSKTILIVDDDPLGLSLLETCVSTEGFNVVTAPNGVEARQKLQGGLAPDLIITDLMMPQEGGYEFLRNLASEGVGRLPIFVVTASKMNPSTVEMIKQEANVIEFMAKPVPRQDLIRKLHATLKTIAPSPRSLKFK